MKEDEIKKEIEYALEESNTEYSHWTIGITDDPERRRKEHRSDGKDTGSWTVWEADTEDIARSVEEYFIDKGMNGAGGGQGTPNFVYIF